MKATAWVSTATLGVMLGCGRPAPVPVIGVAFQGTGIEAVYVARDELAGWPVPIELTFDSAVVGDPADIEVERAKRMVATPGLIAMVGHSSSRGTLAAAPVYNEAGIPQVAPTSTSRLIAAAGPWTFSLAPNDSIEGSFIAEFAAGPLGAHSAAIYYVNDEYGEGLREGVRTRLADRGVAILDEVSVDPLSDFPTLVAASLRRGVPDVVIVAARWVAAGAITRLYASRHPHVPVVAGDGALLMPALVHEVGPAAPSLYVANFWMPDAADSAHAAYVERFRRVTGKEPTGIHAMTHDAIMVVASAIREVGADPARIRDYLASLGQTRPAHAGLTGPVAFGAARRVNFVMTQIAGERLTRVALR